MFKVPFHSCCNEEFIFPLTINPFLFFIKKSKICVKEKKDLMQNRYLGFKNKSFLYTSTKYFKGEKDIDNEVRKSLAASFIKEKNGNIENMMIYKPYKLNTFVCSDKRSCTAQIVEDDRGYVKLVFDYKHPLSKFKSFNYFWNVEVFKNYNKYMVYNLIIDGVPKLIEDNYVKVLKQTNFLFGVMPIFVLCKGLNINLMNMLRSNVEIGFILIQTNFEINQQNFYCELKNGSLINISSFLIFDINFVMEKCKRLYDDIKKISPDTNYIIIFSSFKNEILTIKLNFISIFKGKKHIEIEKNKNFYKCIY